jgi:hypothetical protein
VGESSGVGMCLIVVIVGVIHMAGVGTLRFVPSVTDGDRSEEWRDNRGEAGDTVLNAPRFCATCGIGLDLIPENERLRSACRRCCISLGRFFLALFSATNRTITSPIIFLAGIGTNVPGVCLRESIPIATAV